MRPYRESSGVDYYRHLISLSGVCSYWCNVIRDSPSLWNQIHWSDSPEVIKIALRRSSSQSLHVVLVCVTNEQDPQDITYSFIPALDPHWDRLQRMDIVLPAAWMGFVRTALRKPSLNLEKLSLTDEEALSGAMEIDVFGGTAPRLNDLTLNGVSIRWDSPVLYDLVVLNLYMIKFPSTSTILHVLSHSPRLRTVAIRQCFTNSVAESSFASIQLPQLTSLRLDLGSLDATDDVLAHIEDPGPCSHTTSLYPKEEFGDFLQQRLLKWLSKWKSLALVPFEGLLLEIDGGNLRVELSTADRSEPLALVIEGLCLFWVHQFRVALPQLIDELAWTKDLTTLRLRLGSPPQGGPASSSQQFIIEQVSRLPPVTSLEVLGSDTDSILRGLRLGDVSSLFKNIRTLSFSRIDTLFRRLRSQLDWVRETVQIIKDAAESASDEPNHGGQVLKVEIRVPGSAISKKAELVEDFERLVGSGNVLVVKDEVGGL
ncbi:hypothetical protein FRC04_007553 [Tulasnella sp. 424]|nr:hypothetical protein FRC04_007553 [Tulasnella sp. 424]